MARASKWRAQSWQRSLCISPGSFLFCACSSRCLILLVPPPPDLAPRVQPRLVAILSHLEVAVSPAVTALENEPSASQPVCSVVRRLEGYHQGYRQPLPVGGGGGGVPGGVGGSVCAGVIGVAGLGFRRCSPRPWRGPREVRLLLLHLHPIPDRRRCRRPVVGHETGPRRTHHLSCQVGDFWSAAPLRHLLQGGTA